MQLQYNILYGFYSSSSPNCGNVLKTLNFPKYNILYRLYNILYAENMHLLCQVCAKIQTFFSKPPRYFPLQVPNPSPNPFNPSVLAFPHLIRSFNDEMEVVVKNPKCLETPANAEDRDPLQSCHICLTLKYTGSGIISAIQLFFPGHCVGGR